MTPHLRLCLLAFLAGLVFTVPVLAADGGSEVRVPIASQQPAEREDGLRRALEQVLVRLTGRDDIAADQAVSALLAEPDRYVQRFRYERDGEILRLVALFDEAALGRTLAEKQVPTWSAHRSPVLVWLAVERGSERLLVGADEAPELREELEEAARRRGLRLMFPLLDAEDRRRTGFTDVFGGFMERVRQASERYGTELVLTGRAHREAGEWVGRWILSDGRRETMWASSAAELPATVDAGLRELARRLFQEQAALPLAGSPEADLMLSITGVESLRDYIRARRYLAGVSGVRAVRPLQLEANSVVLELELEIDAARVLRSLEMGRHLARLQEEPADPALEHNFRLLP